MSDLLTFLLPSKSLHAWATFTVGLQITRVCVCVSVRACECECVHMHPDKVITKVTAQVG